MVRLFFLLLWLAFFANACFFAPGSFNDPQDLELVKASFGLSKLPLDLSVLLVFSSLGVLPLLLGSYLHTSRSLYQLPYLPFLLGSMFLGAGALLPYLFLRGEPVGGVLGKGDFYSSKLLRWTLGIALVAMILTALFFGNWAEYLSWFSRSRLVYVMSFDWVILACILWPYLHYTEKSLVSPAQTSL